MLLDAVSSRTATMWNRLGFVLIISTNQSPKYMQKKKNMNLFMFRLSLFHFFTDDDFMQYKVV